MRRFMRVRNEASVCLLVLLGCSSSETAGSTSAPDSGIAFETSDATVDAGAMLDGSCVVPDGGLGNALTQGFGRIDGVISALQMPNDQSCTMPNRDHLVVQVIMKGAVYRMVVNTDVKVLELGHALPAPAFGEGWHTGIGLDYAKDLGASSTSFRDPGDMNATVATILGAGLKVGDSVSVYATSGTGRPESAHLVHRNTNVPNTDGAIVVRPDSGSPKFLLFAFDNQTF